MTNAALVALALAFGASPAEPAGAQAAESGHRVLSVLYSGYFPHDYWDEVIRLASTNHFDLITCDAEKALLDKVHAAGLRCLVGFWLTKRAADDPAAWATFLDKLRAQVGQLRDHPAVYAWYPVDQPDLHRISPAQAMAAASVIRGLDRGHPILTALFEPDRWSDYFDTADIIALTPYLLRRAGGGSDPPTKVTDTIRQLRRDLRHRGVDKDIWAILGAFELKAKRPELRPAPYHKPSPAEWQEMVSLALVEGVGGIAAFTARLDDHDYSWTITSDPQLWDAVRKLPSRISK